MKPRVIGYASDIAANKKGAAQGPAVLKNSKVLRALSLEWEAILETSSQKRGLVATAATQTLCKKLASYIKQFIANKTPFLTIGGDHSSAIGTWSGAASGLNGPLGLIWIDAHMDAHTPDTSTTKNIHGMPVAVLLGHGDPALTQISSTQAKCQPENMVLIGVRSCEIEEAELLAQLNVRVYFMEEINERGLAVVLKEALKIVTTNTAGFGVSIDLDGIDPKDAPDVTIRVEDGIRAQDLLENLSPIAKHPDFIGAEIAEFFPGNDKNQKTEKLIAGLIQKLFS